MADNEIRIGALATNIGPFAAIGKDGIRGVEMAITEFGGQIAGRKIKLFKAGSNAMPEDAYSKAQELVEQRRVDFMVGPLSGNEGMAVRDYAKTQPERTFINGVSAGQDMTLRDPAPNFFSFSTNGVQWMAGLGNYAYHTLGYRRVATIAEDYSFPHSQVRGFALPFCQAGGEIAKKLWVFLGKMTFSDVLAQLPDDIDAIFVAVSSTSAIHFFEQYYEAGGTLPLMCGTNTGDPTTLNIHGPLAEKLVGMVSAGPVVDGNPHPAWQTFAQAYREHAPAGQHFPSMAAHGYYVNTKAALLALQMVDGDLSGRQERFKAALQDLAFDTPTGPVRLDHNRQAIADIYLKQLDLQVDGSLYSMLVDITPEVNSTLGMPEADYLTLGPIGRD
ncbi:MAG: ABC transporter substrate-binding protein [Burkholderiales bacterium]|nr:ABC transporter substrate-binding protein [Anaerolineae bacterium]